MHRADIGFIGLGKMGLPMASRLADAHYSPIVYDLRSEAIEAACARGARPAASPAAVADAAETVLLSLPTPAIVRDVALGTRGVSAGTRVKRLVDLSTTGATTARDIAVALTAKGITMVDAPVSGGIAGATQGTLALMVACPRALFDDLAPMLQHLGKVFFVGERPGMGQTMKLANNLLSATALAATAEAVVFGVKAGLDPRVMIDVINASSGRNSASQDKFPRAILPRTFDFGFTTGLMCKDLDLCHAEAAAANIPMAVADAVRALWRRVATEIGPDADFTTIMQVVEAAASVEIKPS